MTTRELANVMELPRIEEEVDELSLLLPSWQIMALAEAAEDQGVTVAQFMRRLVSQALRIADWLITEPPGRQDHSMVLSFFLLNPNLSSREIVTVDKVKRPIRAHVATARGPGKGDNMLGLFTKKPRGQRRAARTRCRPAIEPLETRAVPATITLVGAARFQDGAVASLVYTGNNHYTAINLRSAIVGANNLGGPDTIVLETGTYTMNSGAGAFLVSDPSGTLTIMNGQGGTSTIDALGRSRVFLNQSGLSLSGLIIEHGVASDRGGAIFNNGTLNITNCQFVGNEAFGGSDGFPVQGGAIFSNGNRILNVQNTSFTANVARGGITNFLLGGTASAAGGAIFIGAGGAYTPTPSSPTPSPITKRLAGAGRSTMASAPWEATRPAAASSPRRAITI